MQQEAHFQEGWSLWTRGNKPACERTQGRGVLDWMLGEGYLMLVDDRHSRGEPLGSGGQVEKGPWVGAGHREGGEMYGWPWGNHRVVRVSFMANYVGAHVPLITSPSLLSSIFYHPC